MKSDMQLQWDVCNALGRAASRSGAGIGIAVRDGVVTLTGNVRGYLDKWVAEAAVGRVAGVRAVAVELRVNPFGSAHRDNAEIAHAAAVALEKSACLPANAVRILVDNGHVTLHGDVESEEQRDAAGTVVRWLTGVTGISNNTRVRACIAQPGQRVEGPAATRSATCAEVP